MAASPRLYTDRLDQNDRIFASLVECVLWRSFSEHWRKNGIDPRPTTYQSRRSTWQGPTVDLDQGSNLTVWALNCRFFASLVECVLRGSLSKHWRKKKNGVDLRPKPTQIESGLARHAYSICTICKLPETEDQSE